MNRRLIEISMCNSALIIIGSFICLLSTSASTMAQQARPIKQMSQPRQVLLFPKGAPGAIGNEAQDRPTLDIYLPEKAKAVGTAVIVCPGGGYGFLAVDHEGKQVAEWLNGHGVAAFVLKYRIAPRYRHPAPLQDAQRALRFVRANAADFGIRRERIGIWGFSAGGHLAATTATHFDKGASSSADLVERASSRPDFLILAYPVITFSENFMHRGSRDNLLGANPDLQLIENLSNERQVTAETPPTFLFHTNEDDGVPPENSIAFYTALRRAKVPAELHIYERGAHGVGLAAQDAVLSTWSARLADWLKVRGLLKDERSKLVQ